MIIILLQKSQPKKLKKSYLEKEKEEKEVQELKKKKKKKKDITKPDLTDYKSLTVQDSWQALYQIFPINLLNKFIKLSLNSDIMITHVTFAEQRLCLLS